MASASGLSAKHRKVVRQRALQAARLVIAHEPQVHYTMGPERWEGIAKHKSARHGQYPTQADCSSMVTWCLWNGLYLSFKVRDLVNGSGTWIDGGYTGTLLNHGKQIKWAISLRVGDVIIYGVPGTNGKHTAMVIGRNKLGVPMVMSHGSEGGPYELPYNYRKDIMSMRRYI